MRPRPRQQLHHRHELTVESAVIEQDAGALMPPFLGADVFIGFVSAGIVLSDGVGSAVPKVF